MQSLGRQQNSKYIHSGSRLKATKIFNVLPGSTPETAFNISGRFGNRIFRSSIPATKVTDPNSVGIKLGRYSIDYTTPPTGYTVGYGGDDKFVFVSSTPHWYNLRVKRKTEVKMQIRDFSDPFNLFISPSRWTDERKTRVLKPGSYYVTINNYSQVDIPYQIKLTLNPYQPKQSRPKDTNRDDGRSGSVDYDCSDFSSQSQAQKYLLPGDPYGLDRDGDGIACEG